MAGYDLAKPDLYEDTLRMSPGGALIKDEITLLAKFKEGTKIKLPLLGSETKVKTDELMAEWCKENPDFFNHLPFATDKERVMQAIKNALDDLYYYKRQDFGHQNFVDDMGVNGEQVLKLFSKSLAHSEKFRY